MVNSKLNLCNAEHENPDWYLDEFVKAVGEGVEAWFQLDAVADTVMEGWTGGSEQNVVTTDQDRKDPTSVQEESLHNNLLVKSKPLSFNLPHILSI